MSWCRKTALHGLPELSTVVLLDKAVDDHDHCLLLPGERYDKLLQKSLVFIVAHDFLWCVHGVTCLVSSLPCHLTTELADP